MYQIGDLIVYGGEGVCRVLDVGDVDSPHFRKDCSYYKLEPLYRDGVIYTPVDVTVSMRPVISREAAQHLIEQIPNIDADPCQTEDTRTLTEHYRTAMQSYDCEDLLQLIKTVYAKQTAAKSKGKKLGQIDERYMKRAEDILHGELAVALDIPKDDVKAYIETCVTRLEARRGYAHIEEVS